MCEFCERYEWSNEFWNKEQKRETYSVALVEDLIKGGRSTIYGFDLNFCPVCGKRISPAESEEEQ